MLLSVLDQSPIPEGSSSGKALRNTIDLARLADGLGYHRYWVAEHHGTPSLACNSPEVLIGPIAAATSRLRVGSGGIMLPHYSPLKVAETFSMLCGLFPGRIDLGIGRAAGTSPNVALALQRDRRQLSPDDFPDQLAELLGYFENGNPRLQFERPENFLLGSSAQSAIWAAELGLPYVFADFINSDGIGIAAHYRSAFVPSLARKAPGLAVALWAICAETVEEAHRLSLSMRMMLTLLQKGRSIPVPTVEQAARFLTEDAPIPLRRRVILGSPSTIRPAIEAAAREYGADEVFLVNILHDHEARRRSYELIAQAFDLSGTAGTLNGTITNFASV